MKSALADALALCDAPLMAQTVIPDAVPDGMYATVDEVQAQYRSL